MRLQGDVRAQVPVRAMEERETRLADTGMRAREAAQRAERLWGAALAAGWDHGFCASVEAVAQWHADLLRRFEAACEQEAQGTRPAALVRTSGSANVKLWLLGASALLASQTGMSHVAAESGPASQCMAS